MTGLLTRTTFGWASIAALAFATACGGYPAPNDQLAASQAAIRAAAEVGADNEPKAALHLKLAREQLEAAKGMMEEGDNEPAERRLLRAEADAELARAIARSVEARGQAEKATEQLEKLKDIGE